MLTILFFVLAALGGALGGAIIGALGSRRYWRDQAAYDIIHDAEQALLRRLADAVPQDTDATRNAP